MTPQLTPIPQDRPVYVIQITLWPGQPIHYITAYVPVEGRILMHMDIKGAMYFLSEEVAESAANCVRDHLHRHGMGDMMALQVVGMTPSSAHLAKLTVMNALPL